jgi:SAM-dependent methyltransferase
VERIRPLTFWKRNLIHQELLRAVLSRAKGGILEVGIGSGAQSALLSRRADRVVSIDNDPRIMRAARPNVERFGPKTRLVLADAFHMPFRDGAYGVSLSQGLMEHFDDEGIAGLVREQLRVCRSVVFSVPSDRYPRQDVGNERLMPPTRWQEIVERAVGPGYAVRARYYRADLEAIKYSVLARRWLGSFSVLVTVDRR